MGKAKNESMIISSFFAPAKARNRSQKQTKAAIVTTGEQNIASRTRPATGGKNIASRTRPATGGQSIASRTRKDLKLAAKKTEQKPNATLDSFINNKRKVVVKDKNESCKENTPVIRAPTFKPPSRSDTARRRRALFERVRAKGQKTIEETLQGMDPVKKKQKAMLSRAREIANSLSFLYIQKNKTVMFVEEAATRIVESSDVPISKYEAIEHFELLTKIAPKWCQFSTNKDKNDLLTINTSMPTWEVREIVEERTKNFR